MALSACKVPINDRLRREAMRLLDTIDTFEEEMLPRLEESDVAPTAKAGFYQTAINIDQSAIAALELAVDAYDSLNNAIGEAIPG